MIKIFPKLNNISFQRKLIANCSVSNNGTRYPCKLYEYDPDVKQDMFYFKSLNSDDEWSESCFLKNIINDMVFKPENKFYSLEGEHQECLAISEVANKKESDELFYIETSKKHSSQNEKRNIKYIGETMLACLVKIAQKTKKENFVVPDVTPWALSFYLKYGFREDVFEESYSIPASKFDKLLQKSEEHTSIIELVG